MADGWQHPCSVEDFANAVGETEPFQPCLSQNQRITVASVEGKGSTFTLQLPAVSGAEPAGVTENGSIEGAPQPSAARGEGGVRGPRG